MNDLLERAERFARVCHAGQCRKGAAKELYTIHLEEVSSLVATWGGSDEAIAAAWLHDTVLYCVLTRFPRARVRPRAPARDRCHFV